MIKSHRPQLDLGDEFIAGFIAERPEQSDTPREAGGLMSWAASKAVGLLV